MVDVQQLYPQMTMLSVQDHAHKRAALSVITNQTRAKKAKLEHNPSCSDATFLPSRASPALHANHKRARRVSAGQLSLVSYDLELMLPFFDLAALRVVKGVCKKWYAAARAAAEQLGYLEDHLLEVVKFYKIPYPFQHLGQVPAKIRATLIDWLAEVSDEFHLDLDTFHVCVNYIDRYLSAQMVPTAKLQLLGCACLLIASKMEEIYPPALQDLVEVSDFSVVPAEIVKMEQDVLITLQFYMAAVTPRSFLLRFIKCYPVKPRVTELANFLLALAAVELNMCKYDAALVAASALCVALHTYGETAWSRELEMLTHYGIHNSDMLECVGELWALHRSRLSAYALTGVIDVFSRDTYGRAAIVPAATRNPIEGFCYCQFYE